MNKLAALLAAVVLAAVPYVTHAGATDCPDFTADGRVTTMDILFVIDNYQQPKGDGTFYAITDLLTVVQRYGDSCS